VVSVQQQKIYTIQMLAQIAWGRGGGEGREGRRNKKGRKEKKE
jgi:hypothetical protein